MPHQMTTINQLLSNLNNQILSISYKNALPLTDFDNLDCIRFTDYSSSQILDKILEFKPDILVVAGWFVRDYVRLSIKVRKKLLIPVVSYSDSQWRNTLTQKINSLISPFYLKRAFTHIWVAGFYQFEYARRLGYSKEKIIFHSLSCSNQFLEDFERNSVKAIEKKRFLYVGRFIELKGVDLLVDAWNKISDKLNWELVLIGDGPLKKDFTHNLSLIVKEFKSNDDVIHEMRQADCFILPSRFEQWGMVLHEAAASGLPIVATTVCGAAPHFLVNNFNGFLVKPDVESIKISLLNIMNLSNDELLLFSKNSKFLSRSINPKLSVASLYSVLN
jgi:glycosyltransferase involved in cell wall biosynthesis